MDGIKVRYVYPRYYVYVSTSWVPKHSVISIEYVEVSGGFGVTSGLDSSLLL